MSNFFDRIKARQEDIHRWLESYEGSKELPLYSSVDIRDAGFKMAVVDTNLFPAGFNNLCPHGIEDSVLRIKDAVLARVENCRRILIVAEEHTRNTWYLENVRILEDIIKRAGFEARIATFLHVQPAFCEKTKYVELETATGHAVRIHCFQEILNEIKAGKIHFDLIILNNDLTSGIPEVLKNAKIPIYPSIQAGWHSRLKSHHFCHTANLINEFADMIGFDPWLFSSIYAVVDHIDIHDAHHRARVMDKAADLFKKIQAKYTEHGITEKPFLFIKADSGTYGMSVVPIEDPNDIVQLNRKNRNRLFKGKNAQMISRYLLQEGIPTIHQIGHKVSEVCIYQIANKLVGGFYRSHGAKGSRENLNAQGMDFQTMCPHLSKYGDCGIHHNMNIFDIYRILARIAGIAAHREIIHLENNKK